MVTEDLEVEDFILTDDDFGLNVVSLQKGALVELRPHKGQGQVIVCLSSVAIEGDFAVGLSIGIVEKGAVSANIVVAKAKHIGLVMAEVVKQVAVGSGDEVVIAVQVCHIFTLRHCCARVACPPNPWFSCVMILKMSGCLASYSAKIAAQLSGEPSFTHITSHSPDFMPWRSKELRQRGRNLSTL